jgi:hypothetical protein
VVGGGAAHALEVEHKHLRRVAIDAAACEIAPLAAEAQVEERASTADESTSALADE